VRALGERNAGLILVNLRQLNWIEVGRVSPQEDQLHAEGFQMGARLNVLMGRQIVDHHAVSRTQTGSQFMPSLHSEGRPTHRTFELPRGHTTNLIRLAKIPLPVRHGMDPETPREATVGRAALRTCPNAVEEETDAGRNSPTVGRQPVDIQRLGQATGQ
jgi:hypothetical protein